MKVVIDTNILIQGNLGPYSFAQQIIDWVISNDMTAYLTHQIIRENKLKTKELITDRNYLDLIDEYFDSCQTIRSKNHFKVIKADRDDDKQLNGAVAAKVDYIISNDHHLLDLEKYQGIKIINDKDFVDLFRRLNDKDGKREWQDWVNNIFTT